MCAMIRKWRKKYKEKVKIEGKGIRRGRKRPLKCELSFAKETRAAPLPVIGLAPFPKNLLSPALHLLLPCSIPLLFSSPPPPSHFPCRWLPCVCDCFLGFGGAWQSRRDSVSGYSRLWLAFVGID